MFNHGLYDTHILLKKTPFLEWESPIQLDKLVAEDVMNSSGSKLTYLYPITRVRSIERILRTTVHSAFPVVTLIDASAIPVLPKNIKSNHMPLLYTRRSVLFSDHSDSAGSPVVRVRKPITEDCEEDGAFYEDERDFEKTYTVPRPSWKISEGEDCS